MRFTDGAAVLAAVGSPLGHSSWHIVRAQDVASYVAAVAGSPPPPPDGPVGSPPVPVEEAPAGATAHVRAEDPSVVLPVVARLLAPAGAPSTSGSGVVPGGLTVGLAAVFLAELLAVVGYVGVDYGLDRVRFPAPLVVGTAVRARGLLLGARCEGDAVRTVVELTYETEAGGRAPCVAQVVTLLMPLR